MSVDSDSNKGAGKKVLTGEDLCAWISMSLNEFIELVGDIRVNRNFSVYWDKCLLDILGFPAILLSYE